MFARLLLAAAFALTLNAQASRWLLVERITPADGGYELHVRNVSRSDLAGYVAGFESNGFSLSMRMPEEGKPILAAGAEGTIFVKHKKPVTAEQLEDALVLSAIFADGSYEGDPVAVARLLATQRFTAAVRAAVPAGAPIKFGEARVLALGLPTEVEPATLTEMTSRLQLNEAEKGWVRNAYEASATMQKNIVLSQIASAERSNDLAKLGLIFGQ